MPRAIWNEAVIAESSAESVKIVEGNVYFPREAVQAEFLKPSDEHTICPWKGTASYYDVVVAGKVNSGAAWYYPEPKPAAREIAGRIAFWRGVIVEK
jgi:uncharacterized protein (DUF427 family)